MRKYLVTTTNDAGRQRESFVGTSREAAVRFMKAEIAAPKYWTDDDVVSVSLFREITPGSNEWILLENHAFGWTPLIVEESVVRQRENTWINSAPPFKPGNPSEPKTPHGDELFSKRGYESRIVEAK